MKISRQTVYSLWAAAIVVCVLLSVFSLFFSACAKQNGSSTQETSGPGKKDESGFSISREDGSGGEPETVSETEEPAPPETSSVRLEETPDAGREYLDQLIFLGDSTTYGIGYYYRQGYTELCPPEQIWTPASGTLTLYNYAIATIVYPETGEEITIEEAAKLAKPKYLVITLGVNGIAEMDEEWFIRDYTALVKNIQKASPETRIILNSMYPIAASYQYWNQINNDKIRAGNEWIERIAADTGCRFLYSYESVVGADGNLPEDSHNGDSLHLTGEAFTKVMRYIRTHAWSE